MRLVSTELFIFDPPLCVVRGLLARQKGVIKCPYVGPCFKGSFVHRETKIYVRNYDERIVFHWIKEKRCFK